MTAYQLPGAEVLEELRRQAVNFDSKKYKVMVIWDPISSRDVGWLTVKTDVLVDFSKFQCRDVNLQALLSTKPVRASPAFSQMIDSSDHVAGQAASDSSHSTTGNTNLTDDTTEDVIDMGDDSNGDYHESVNMDMNENLTSIQTEQNLLISSQTCSKMLPVALKPTGPPAVKQKKYLRSCFKRQCPQCHKQMSHATFVDHLRSAHNLQLEKEEVTCDICGIPIYKVNLEFHKSTTHFAEREPIVIGLNPKKLQCSCGKQYSTNAGLKKHMLRYCGKQSSYVGLGGINEIRRQSKMLANKEPQISSRENIKEQTVPGQGVVLGDKIESTASESSLNRPTIRKERVLFKVVYQGLSYACSRNKKRTIKKSLNEFCQDIIGKELSFEFQGKILTGTEGVAVFEGDVIVASDV